MKGKYIILEKIEDRIFDGNHPNFINVGCREIQGWCVVEPVIGEQFYLYYYNTDSPKLGNPFCTWTSKVETIDIDNMLLRTKNSVYKIEINEK